MARIIKIEGYIVDTNDGGLSPSAIQEEFAACVFRLDMIRAAEFDIKPAHFEWNDDCIVNSVFCTQKQAKEFFEKANTNDN